MDRRNDRWVFKHPGLVKPQIVSIGYAIPEYHYTQEEVFEVLKYPSQFRRVFTQSGITRRYFARPLDSIMGMSFQQQQETYHVEAQLLSRRAVDECLDGRDPRQIGCLVYGTCTGIAPGPTIAHLLGRDLKLSPNVYYTNITAHGCESAFPGLRRAYDHVIASGKPVLVINCELSSLTYYPEQEGKPDPENHFEVLRANSIFGDGASAALIGYSVDPRHPFIVDTETFTNTDFMGDLGYVWKDGRLRVRLSRRVPELAALVVKPAVLSLLERQQMDIHHIKWWVIHAAGNTVLDNVRDALGLPEEKVRLSRETLQMCGNTSSTSVGITGTRLMRENIRSGDYAGVISIGPGMTGGMVLLHFTG